MKYIVAIFWLLLTAIMFILIIPGVVLSLPTYDNTSNNWFTVMDKILKS